MLDANGITAEIKGAFVVNVQFNGWPRPSYDVMVGPQRQLRHRVPCQYLSAALRGRKAGEGLEPGMFRQTLHRMACLNGRDFGWSFSSFVPSLLQQQAAAPHAPASQPEVMSKMPDLMSEVNVRPSQIGCLMSFRRRCRKLC